jgi:outer membrane protein assembly factor BamB/tetratricopeptide (TPR) repeat protein
VGDHQQTVEALEELFVQTGNIPEDLPEIEAEVVKQIDGVRTVREQFKDFYGTRFELCALICKLLDNGSIRPLTVEECTAAAEEAIGKKFFPQAVSYLKFAVQSKPDAPELQYHLGQALASAFQEAESRQAFVCAVRLYAEQGDLERTAEVATGLIPGSDLEAADLELCFQAFVQVSNFKKAVAAGTQLVGTLQENGEVERAAKILERIAELDPKDLNLKIQVADILHKVGETERAKVYLDEVSEIVEQQKKYRELLKVIRLSLRIDPEQQHLKEKATAIQALIEKLELQKKRRVTYAGGALIAALLLSIGPTLYEIKAREYFHYAGRMEQIALASSDYPRAKQAYTELIEKYSFSTKVAEAQSAIHRLTHKETQLEAQAASVGVNPEETQRRIEEIRRAFLRLAEKAKAAEAGGDHEQAHALYLKLRTEFAEVPASQQVPLPLKITSRPLGALIAVGQTEIGKTPFIHYYTPGDSLDLTLTRRSCEPLEESVELTDQWQLHFDLERRPLTEFSLVPTIEQDMQTAGGLIIQPSRDGSLYALNPARKETVWEKPVGRFGDRVSDVTVFRDVVYFVDVAGSLNALQIRSGEVMWRAPVGSGARAAPAVSADGRHVAVCTTAGAVYVLDATSGTATAKVPTENEIVARPFFAGDLLIAGSRDNNLYGYSLKSRALQFVWELSDDIVMLEVVDTDTTYVVTADSRIHKLDVGSTKTVWSQALEELPSARIVANDRGVYLGTGSGQLVSLDPASGNLRWSLSAGDGAIGGLASTGDHVFVCFERGHLTAVGIKERAISWTFRTGSPLVTSPLIIDKVLCVGSLSGKTWLFEVME